MTAEPLPLPIRVLVKGASTAVWTSTMYGPRADMTYPRVIEEQLLRAGHPAEVRVSAMVAAQARSALKTWEPDVVQWSPDVVVLHYGHFECIHLFLPWRLLRHANGMKRRPGPIHAYRTYGVRSAYKVLARIQTRIDALDRPSLHARRRRRLQRDLERLITRVREVASPLVLVPDIVPPGKIWDRHFPGARARMAAMNQTLEGVVDQVASPDVRLFKATDAVAPIVEEGTEEVSPDGGHYTARAHRLVGEALAKTILEWVATQPHLALQEAPHGDVVAAPASKAVLTEGG